LLARIAESNTIVGARLRPGNTGFGRADVGWLRSVIRRVRKELGPDVTIVVRIDAAADCVEVMKALDQLRVIFVIKAKMTPDLCRAVAEVRGSEEDRVRIAVCEDPATLDRWCENVLGAKTVDEVLS